MQVFYLYKNTVFKFLLCDLQSRDSALLQDLSVVLLRASQQAEALLKQTDGGLLSLWLRSLLRRSLTIGLPHFLTVLQQTSLLGQQELRSEELNFSSLSQ